MSRYSLLRQVGWMAVCVAMVVGSLVIAPRGANADPLQENTSLRYAPSDVSFYIAGLRMGEVFDKVMASKAVAQLKSVPVIEMGTNQLMAMWQNPPLPQVAMFKMMLADPANQQLVEMLKDGVSHEFFVYGDESVGDMLQLANDINTAVNVATIEAESAGDPATAKSLQMRKVAELLEQYGDRVKVPRIVEGMKLSDTQPAIAQLQRLEAMAQAYLQSQPDLQSGFKRETIGQAEFLTLRLTGKMLPWQLLLSRNQDADPQALQKLQAVISSLDLVLGIGVVDDYLVFSIGPDTTHLAAFGAGDKLYDREEMAPIRAAADKPITEIVFASSQLMQQMSAVDQQMEQLVTMVDMFAPMMVGPNVPLQDELNADMRRLAEAVKQSVPKPGSVSSFNYLTPEGYESYSYSWSGESALDASKNLTILDHLGGSPLAFFAARGKSDPQQYEALVTVVSRLAYYAEKIALQNLEESQLEVIASLKTDLLPLVEQLNTVTRDKLIPAFADGQSALVLDAESTSDAWHFMLPSNGAPCRCSNLAWSWRSVTPSYSRKVSATSSTSRNR